tara:strand:- start:244 stop:714 length:471 start_codon:yes stop_codon:yes gene_type:complete
MSKNLSKTQKIKQKMYAEGFNRIESWLHDKGWTVDCDYCVRDEIFFNGKYITISKRQGSEKRLYSLLHECGHLLIQQNNTKYEEAYPAQAKMSQFLSNKRIEKSKDYRVETLTEEIEAWKRGKNLADRLGIFVEDKNFQKLTNECIYTYIEWAAKP